MTRHVELSAFPNSIAIVSQCTEPTQSNDVSRRPNQNHVRIVLVWYIEWTLPFGVEIHHVKVFDVVQS